MAKNKRDESVKEKIIKATENLLKEEDIDSITSRNIAEKAGVGLGNINYHFKSKDDLLAEVVLKNFQTVFRSFDRNRVIINNPREELEQIIFEMFEFILKYKKIGRYVLKYKLTNRTFKSERYLLQYLNKYYENKGISQLNLRLKAMQINSAVLVAFFNSDEFYKYAEIDLYNKEDLRIMIRGLIDNVFDS